jgi:hypothetical protein
MDKHLGGVRVTVRNEPARLPVIIRPNGNPYRPRGIRTARWDNEDTYGVIVLGTHDVDLAQTHAVEGCRFFFGCEYALKPEKGWWRSGMDRGDPAWFRDEVRGAAGVMFTASDDPEESR